MIHNDAVQHRAGEQPSASTPKASQEPSRAQSAAKLQILNPRPADHRHENSAMPGLRDGVMDAKPIHIYGKHSPLSRLATHSIATHATMQRPLHQDGLMAGPLLAHMHQQKPARHHSLGDGHVQALSVFGPELGTWKNQQSKVQHQQPHFSTQNLYHSSTALPLPARHTLPGEGNV